MSLLYPGSDSGDRILDLEPEYDAEMRYNFGKSRGRIEYSACDREVN